MTPEEFLEENDIYDYDLIGDYFIGRWDVIFGCRIRAGRVFDLSVPIDVCCGTSEHLLCLVKELYQKKMKLNVSEGKYILEGLRPSSEIKPIHNDIEYMEWLSELKEELDE
jgi:hypothetical protein